MMKWCHLKYFAYIAFFFQLFSCASRLTQKETLKVDPYEKFTPEELKEDLDFLFQTYEEVHPNLYAFVSKDFIDSERKRMEESITIPMTQKEFYRKIAPIVVKFQDGHTWIGGLSSVEYKDSSRASLFPFDIYIDQKRIFVDSNYSSDTTIAINTEILSINETPVSTILDSLFQFANGKRQSYKEIHLEMSFRYWMWIAYGFSDQYVFELLPPNGDSVIRKVIHGVTWKEYEVRKKRKENKEIPNYRYYTFKEEKIGVIDFRRFRNLRIFKKFLKTTFKQLQKDNIRHLIIDIRRNGGGNSQLGDALISYITSTPYIQAERMEVKASRKVKKLIKEMYLKWYLYPLYPLAYIHPQGRAIFVKPAGTITVFEFPPKKPKPNPLRFSGEVYLLISSHTFSSASMFASAFQCYGMGTVIGEETGGLTVSYGDIVKFSLPNTKLLCGVSYKKFILPCGKEDGHGVIPDYQVYQTPEDLEKGIDTVMEFTKDLIRRSRL